VQILGAEKALFRALKTKGNTPKYGLIYHSTFIGRADAKNKGRISRYLANKCSIATRIDSFSYEPNRLYGERLRDQVEERLKFYETGAAPRRNVDVMEEVARELKGGKDEEMEDAKPKSAKKEKKKSKKKDDSESDDSEDEKMETPKSKKDKKKEKKEKKSSSKKRKAGDDSDDEEAEKSAKKAKKSEIAETPKSDKKKKKKDKKRKSKE
jgi:nucleolar protein 56